MFNLCKILSVKTTRCGFALGYVGYILAGLSDFHLLYGNITVMTKPLEEIPPAHTPKLCFNYSFEPADDGYFIGWLQYS